MKYGDSNFFKDQLKNHGNTPLNDSILRQKLKEFARGEMQEEQAVKKDFLIVDSEPVKEIDKQWKPVYKKAAALFILLEYMPEKDRLEASLSILSDEVLLQELWRKRDLAKEFGRLPASLNQDYSDLNPYELLRKYNSLSASRSYHKKKGNSVRVEELTTEINKVRSLLSL